MPVLSDDILWSRITAGQVDIGVWVRRTASGAIRRRCHLVCHWLQHLLSNRRLNLVSMKVAESAVGPQATW
jgi:hypothetical protein